MGLTPAPFSCVAPDPQFHCLQTWNREEGWGWSLKVADRGNTRFLGRKASSSFNSLSSLGLAGIASDLQRCWTEHPSTGKSLLPLSFRGDPGTSPSCAGQRLSCAGCTVWPQGTEQSHSSYQIFLPGLRTTGCFQRGRETHPSPSAAAAFPAATFLPLSALQRARAGAQLCRGRSEI